MYRLIEEFEMVAHGGGDSANYYDDRKESTYGTLKDAKSALAALSFEPTYNTWGRTEAYIMNNDGKILASL